MYSNVDIVTFLKGKDKKQRKKNFNFPFFRSFENNVRILLIFSLHIEFRGSICKDFFFGGSQKSPSAGLPKKKKNQKEKTVIKTKFEKKLTDQKTNERAKANDGIATNIRIGSKSPHNRKEIGSCRPEKDHVGSSGGR